MRAFLAAALGAAFSLGYAQSYPSKPIRLIVPYAAGGMSDILARQIGPKARAQPGKQGTEVRTGTPEALGEWLRTEQARWARVVKESGAKFE
jgi:tripartite-type tricarboxylate transporter receptor subunit TctC